MKLQADGIDARPLPHCTLNLHVIWAAFALIPGTFPHAAMRLVDDKFISWEKLLGSLEAPFNEILLPIKISYVPARTIGVPQRLISNFPHSDSISIAFRQLAEALDQEPLLLGDITDGPLRRYSRIVEDMRLRLNPVLFTPVNAKVWRRTAIQFRSIRLISRFTLLRLKPRPIERTCRQVERLGKAGLVCRVELRAGHLVEHKKICSIFEIVRLLRHLEMHVLIYLSRLVLECKEHRTFSIHLDTRFNTRIGIGGTDMEQVENGLSVILHSRPQRRQVQPRTSQYRHIL